MPDSTAGAEDSALFGGLGGGPGSPLPSQMKPPGRPVWRIVVGGILLVLGGIITAVGVFLSMAPEARQKWMFRASVAGGAAVCGLGFAVYDSRWPFGRKKPRS